MPINRLLKDKRTPEEIEFLNKAFNHTLNLLGVVDRYLRGLFVAGALAVIRYASPPICIRLSGGLGAGISQNAPAAVSELPKGIPWVGAEGSGIVTCHGRRSFQ